MPRSLATYLLDAGHVDAATLEAARREASDDLALAEVLAARGLVERPLLLKARSELLGVPTVEINPYSIDPQVVEVVPEDLARRHRVVALFRVGDDLTLAMADPTDVLAIDRIRDATGCEVNPVLADGLEIDHAIAHYYSLDAALRTLVQAATDSVTEVGPAAPLEEQERSLEELDASASPLVRIVNLLLLQAVRSGASDIHVEPDEHALRIRYRVDGRLRAAQELPLSLHAGMVSRIKILAELDLAQKRLPQDGRISLRAEGRRIDMRISSLPTIRGEKIVIRLLDKGSTLATLDHLGLEPGLEKTWRNLVHLPNGILLVTGPTGSGKTTTLYASLAAINTLDRNIVTVEDPVEYDFPVINQVQVHAKAGLTFATALRSILRQDPNVVMVGEIRDRETAAIAIRAALTGHLVLSTLHTNDAGSAATRLIDMGVEPYLVASALKGVLAQRLVRRLCRHCAQPVALEPGRYPDGVAAWLQQEGIEPQVGRGCRHCGGSGLSGRVALHELLVVEDDIETAIVRERPTSEIRALARRRGMRDLFDDGLAKVRAGLTTVDEVLVAVRMQEDEEAAAAPEVSAAAPLAASLANPAPDTSHAPIPGGPGDATL